MNDELDLCETCMNNRRNDNYFEGFHEYCLECHCVICMQGEVCEDYKKEAMEDEDDEDRIEIVKNQITLLTKQYIEHYNECLYRVKLLRPYEIELRKLEKHIKED